MPRSVTFQTREFQQSHIPQARIGRFLTLWLRGRINRNEQLIMKRILPNGDLPANKGEIYTRINRKIIVNLLTSPANCLSSDSCFLQNGNICTVAQQ